MSTAEPTKRRWLKSAIAAASHEQVVLPWATKNQTRQHLDEPTAVVRISPSAPSHYVTIAAR